MTKENWKKEIEKWQQSKLSMAEFCREENLSYWSFRQWRTKIQESDIPSAKNLVKLNISQITPRKTGLDSIDVFIGDVKIIVPPNFDEASLIRLINALRKVS